VSTSKYIAGLLGPLLAVIGLSMLLNRSLFPEMVTQLASNYGLVFIAGILTLIAGIAIVRAHNIWEASWRVVITIFGWLGVIGGVARVLFPHRAAAIAGTFVDTGTLTVAAMVVLALGAFLTFKAYATEN
jgi:hypothetical protein